MERSASSRLVALDWMRGFVMVLMAIDHASVTFNAGRVSEDSAAMYMGGALPAAQFFTRFVTHLCAPTFVVLAGAAAALGVARRPGVDRDLLVRGLILIALDLLW
ncbi:MAG TPA: heparan-alpha-glucosaminide N-acetyltransferase domain-containing protein, partial [Nannocystaceae bacterium]|nr:heparan-alpha-glucosaminide N-acetyltransferase domain-containing protein [Nannocystaceae bacterium]